VNRFLRRQKHMMDTLNTNRYIVKNIVFLLIVSARDFMRQLQTYDISFLWHNEALNCKTDTWNRLLGPKNHTLDTLYDYISENIVFQFFARVRDFARPPRANPSSDFSGFHTKSSTDPYEPCDQKSALYKFCR